MKPQVCITLTREQIDALTPLYEQVLQNTVGKTMIIGQPDPSEDYPQKVYFAILDDEKGRAVQKIVSPNLAER